MFLSTSSSLANQKRGVKSGNGNGQRERVSRLGSPESTRKRSAVERSEVGWKRIQERSTHARVAGRCPSRPPPPCASRPDSRGHNQIQEQKSRHKTPPLPVRIWPGYPALHLSQGGVDRFHGAQEQELQ